jgi:two-component system, cell cycle response regulator DivK
VEEIIHLAKSGEIKVILMDVSLANSVYQGKSVDGVQITQILKADPETSSLPILLVTAHAMEGDREFFLRQSGADGYISKPVVDHEQFVVQVQNAIAQARQKD